MELTLLLERAPSEIKKRFRHRNYGKGDQILLPGEENDRLFILTSGEAEVYDQNYDGASISLHIFRPVSCFGENEIFNADARTLGIRARRDTGDYHHRQGGGPCVDEG